jgi:hypothetical protein
MLACSGSLECGPSCGAAAAAGLYKQLSTLRDLLNDVRSDPNSVTSLKLPIASNVDACGLQVGCAVSFGTVGTAVAISECK